MTETLAHQLRTDLIAAGFSVNALDELWGAEAAAALHRGQRVPALRELSHLRGDGRVIPALSLAQLFVLGMPVAAEEFERALPTLGLGGAEELGLVALEAKSGEPQVRPLLDLRPYSFTDARGPGNWWIASDLGELALGHPLSEDHVLGIGGASVTLSGLMIQTPVRRVLDLGTGCGIQALHASRHAESVVATDISPRAIELAKLNAAINGIENIEFRLGDMFEPVAGESFDQIVSNPPFVITPRQDGVPTYEYRDAGMVGDALVEAVVRGVGQHLSPGGIAQFLGNWEYGRSDAFDRVSAWLDSPEATALDAWIVEREAQSVAEYSETWIRDGGTRPGSADFDRLYAAWLDDFAQRGITQVGFGYVLMRRRGAGAGAGAAAAGAGAGVAEGSGAGGSGDSGAGDGRSRSRTAEGTGGDRMRRLERLHGPLGSNEPGLGEHLAGALAGRDWQFARDDDSLGDSRLVTAPDITEERHYWPGDDDPTSLLLHQGSGFGRTIAVDTIVAAFVGACDGELSVSAIAGALSDLLGVDRSALDADLIPRVRALIDDGILLPVPD